MGAYVVQIWRLYSTEARRASLLHFFRLGTRLPDGRRQHDGHVSASRAFPVAAGIVLQSSDDGVGSSADVRMVTTLE